MTDGAGQWRQSRAVTNAGVWYGPGSAKQREERCIAPGKQTFVMAGLDPAIHLLRKSLARVMDTRVKPAYDAEYVSRFANFQIQISNSHSSAISRRHAPEFCQ
jgi:hypothetical protein